MASNKAYPSLFLHSRIIDGMASIGSELPSVILEDPLTDIVRLAVLMTLQSSEFGSHHDEDFHCRTKRMQVI